MKANSEHAAGPIRRAALADAGRLAVLSGQLGYPATAKQIERRLATLQDDQEQAVFVFEADGTVMGWIHVAVRHLLETGTQAEIAGLVIDESCRGQGAGRALMSRAEQWAQSKGCPAVRVRSNVIRSRAHAFYEQLGYRVIKSQKVFQKELPVATGTTPVYDASA